MLSFFNPTTEVVTFRLHGWHMLGVFLLPTYIHTGHECQNFRVRATECMCAQTRPLFILSSERVLGVCLLVACLTFQQQASVSQ